MLPVAFKQANGTLMGGPGSDFGTSASVSDLPVHRARETGEIISCWQLSWLDRLRLLLTGKVWLIVLGGQTHAPVCVTAEKPFL